jgi:hypothetical protein
MVRASINGKGFPMSTVTLANGVSGVALGAGSNLVVSDDMIATLRKGWEAKGKGEKFVVACFDMMDANGWSPSHCIAIGEDGSTATEVSWERLRVLVIGAFPKGAQTLLAMPANMAKGQVATDWDGNAYTASGQPKDKRHWQQQIGSQISKLGKQWAAVISAREAKANYLKMQSLIAAGDVEAVVALQGEMEANAPRKTLMPSEFLDEKMTEGVKRIERAKGDNVDLAALKALVLRFRTELRALAKAAQAGQ